MSSALLELLDLSADVLQIGFIKKEFATEIQLKQPKSHVVVESRPERLHNAIKWSKKNRQAKILQGSWEAVLPSLSKFHAIVVEEGDATPVSGRETQHAHVLLEKGAKLTQYVEEAVPGLNERKYSDQDLEEFCQHYASAQHSQISHFLAELKAKGQITGQQYEHVVAKYQLSRVDVAIAAKKAKAANPVFPFVSECLNHLDNGGKFAMLLKEGASYFEDPQFFESIVTNPHLDYQEKTLKLSAGRESLAMLIEKL
ncbi:MAG: hypothetical protein V4492_01415 [Chlamydiota bacterium]